MKKFNLYASVTFSAAIVVAGLLGYRSYERDCEAELVAMEQEMASSAAAVDQRMTRMLSTFDAEVPRIEEFLGGHDRTDAEITEYLRERTRRLSTNVNANYVDLYLGYNGRYLCGNYWRPPKEFSIYTRPWHVAAMRTPGQTAIVSPYIALDYPHMVMAASRKLKLDDAVLSMDVQLSQVEPIFGNVIIGAGGVTFYLDTEGRPVTACGKTLVNGVDLTTIAAKIRTRREQRFADGGNIVISRRARCGWTAVTVNPLSEVFSAARWSLMESLAWALSAFLGLLLLAEFIRYRKDVFASWRRASPQGGRFVAPSIYALAIVVFVASIAYLHHQTDGYESAFTIDSIERQLRQMVVPYEAFINTAKGAAGYCSRQLEPLVLAGADDDAIVKETKRLVGIYRSLYGRNYRNIFVAQGDRYVDSLDRRSRADFHPSDRPWYHEAVTNPNVSFVCQPYVSALDKTEQISITRVMTDPDRTVVGIDISLKMLRTLYGRLHLPGAICTILVSDSGFIIDHRALTGNYQHRHAGTRELVNRAMAEAGSFRVRTVDGDRFVFSVPLSIGGKLLVTADAKLLEDAMFAHHAQAFAILIPVFISVLIVVSLALRRTRRLREREIADRERESQAEALAKALDEAQSANRAKSVFLANMSHDLRTPMNAVLGFADLAKASLGDPDKAKASLDKITTASEQLLAFINNVLEMSHIEAKRTRLDEKPEDLGGILAAIDGLMRHQAEAKRLEFTVGSVPPDTEIVCDRARLNQVLVNLLSNAVKYTNEGGHVSLMTKVEPVADRVRCEFTVRDDGIGMSREFAERMFEPFAREQNTTESGVSGTGLGMPIARRIVELMEGTIGFVTAPGEGTTFTVTIPFDRPGT